MQSVHHPAPVPVVPVPNPVVELVALVGPHQRELVAAVVHDGVESDDEVPHPGGGHVTPGQERTQTYRDRGNEKPVYRVTVGSGDRHGSLPLVMGL